MTDNDIIVLNSVLEQKKNEMAPEYLDFELFELFSFREIFFECYQQGGTL